MIQRNQLNSKLKNRAAFRVKLRRFLFLFAAAYFVLLFILYSKQRELIFAGINQGGIVATPYGVERITLKTSLGDNIAAFFGKALLPSGYRDPEYAKRPTILYFYGSGDNLKDSAAQMEEFRRLGANVLIPDYAGYGMSTGKASETGCYATATAAYNYLRSRPDIDPAKIIVLGWSLGSAVAIDLASRKPVEGLGVFSAFTSMADLGAEQYPIFPKPVIQFVLEHPFDSESKISKVKCPILIGHSRSDLLVPFSMSNRLAAQARTHVTRIVIDHANHGDFFNLGGPTVYPAIGMFIQSLQAVKKPALQ